MSWSLTVGDGCEDRVPAAGCSPLLPPHRASPQQVSVAAESRTHLFFPLKFRCPCPPASFCLRVLGGALVQKGCAPWEIPVDPRGPPWSVAGELARSGPRWDLQGALPGCPETLVQRLPASAWRVTRRWEQMPWLHCFMLSPYWPGEVTQRGEGRVTSAPHILCGLPGLHSGGRRK